MKTIKILSTTLAVTLPLAALLFYATVGISYLYFTEDREQFSANVQKSRLKMGTNTSMQQSIDGKELQGSEAIQLVR